MTQARKLRAVEPGESVAAPPKTLVEASALGRREFLTMARSKVAQTIDEGVPAHALGRLIAEVDRLDGEIRRLDAADEQEVGDVVEDDEFDVRAI